MFAHCVGFRLYVGLRLSYTKASNFLKTDILRNHVRKTSLLFNGTWVTYFQALDQCRQGGFIDASAALKSDAFVALRSPSAAPSCSVLRHVFFLAKSFCDLWTFKDRLAPAYAKALDMLDIEKTNVLGVSGTQTNSRCSSEGIASTILICLKRIAFLARTWNIPIMDLLLLINVSCSLTLPHFCN